MRQSASVTPTSRGIKSVAVSYNLDNRSYLCRLEIEGSQNRAVVFLNSDTLKTLLSELQQADSKIREMESRLNDGTPDKVDDVPF